MVVTEVGLLVLRVSGDGIAVCCCTLHNPRRHHAHNNSADFHVC